MSKRLRRNIIDIALIAAVFAASLGISGLTFKIYDPLMLTAYEARVAANRNALAGGEELTLLEDVQLVDGVSEVYAAQDGTLLISVTTRGFESDVTLNIAIAADGSVANIAAVSHNESPDKGGLALGGEYLGNYVGLDSAQGVDAYTGATYTSEAIKDAVDRALGQYKVLNGLEYDAPESVSNEELIVQALDSTLGAGWEAVDTELVEGVTAVYRSETGSACLVEGMGYDNDTTDAAGPSPVVLLVSFDNEALVTEISVIEQHETEGYGANAFNEYYLNMYDGYGQFTFKYPIPGIDGKVIDSQSNATGTSQSVYYLVKAATEQMKLPG